MIITLAALSLFAQDPSDDVDCARMGSDMEMTVCWGRALEREEARMQEYYLAARTGSEAPQVASTQARGFIEASQTAWTAYAEIACQGVYEAFGEGTLRNLSFIDCKIEMTRERTHVLWRDYLRDTLPEPVGTVGVN